MSIEPQDIGATPEPLIIGLNDMGRLFGRSRQTMARWVRVENFPASRLPNGTYVTEPELIRRWILSRSPCSGQA